MKKMIILLGLILYYQVVFGQTDQKNSHKEEPLKCSTCHSCEIPTKENPCLISCPREHMITMTFSPEEAPNVITMNKMTEKSDLYGPVVFSHKSHAEMSGMSGGCSMCHHYNPTGRVIPCSDCHEVSRKREDISKPDLKGAYHRQCIDCHRTWGGSVKCESCHALTSEAQSEMKTAGKNKAERIHPEIVKPKKLVYETGYENGKIVTFYHNEHVDLYGFKCSDCHKNETCSKCHSKEVSTASNRNVFEEKHKFCSSCHTVDENCEHCHKNKALAPFNHKQRTGFELSKYHKKLSCTQCHGTDKKFTPLNSECISCHSDWKVGKFNHKITGLNLSENHFELDCEMCHLDNRFSTKPSCENCHEEDVSYPDFIPGEFVEKNNY
jgi:hypothetical protein